MKLIAYLVVAGACGPTTLPTTPVIAPPPPTPKPAVAFVAPPLELPATPAPQQIRSLCSPAVATPLPKSRTKSRVYDFTPIVIGLNHGPTIETQASAGFVRDPDTIRVAIIKHTDRLSECMRSVLGTSPGGKPMRVSAEFGRAGTFVSTEIALTIDPFGIATQVAVKTAAAPLARCVEETLKGLRVNRRTPRETHAQVALHFRNLQGVKPTKSPPPPVVAAAGRTGCMLARDPLPIDKFDLEPLAIDFDPSPEEAGRFRRCPSHDVDKHEIRAAINSNLGGLRACYVDARKREPALAGTVTSQFSIGLWGEPADVKIGGAGDVTFHDCLKAALAQIAVPHRPEQTVLVNFPFELDPDDVDEAAAIVVSAREAKSPNEACLARAKLVAHYATTMHASDPRTLAAMTALSTFATEHGRTELASCIAEASASLVAFAKSPMRGHTDLGRWRGGGLFEALERTKLVLAAFPELKRELLPFTGHAYLALRNGEDARVTYLEFLRLDGTDKGVIQDAAEGYAKAVRLLDDGTPWDDCEARARY